MDFKLEKLAKYRQIIGIAIAALILTVIFVPYQKANAFNLTTALPDTTNNTSTQSASGERFTVSINIQSSELIPISSIDVLIDNGQSSVAKTTFTISGTTALYSSGTLGIIKDNALSLTLPSSSQYGYAYGYGFTSTGVTGPIGYSYAIPYSYSFIAGNTVGYANSVGNNLPGFVGPGTITITGFVNTALLSPGPGHTIDVVVNTGAGVNPSQLVSPTLTFTVNANSQITTGSVNSGTDSTTSIAASDGNPVSLRFDFAQIPGPIAIEQVYASFLKSIQSSIFNVVGSSASSFAVGSSTALTAGTIYDIDVSSITHTGFIFVTIKYDPNLLPVGMSENDVKFFHWTGTAWEDATVSVDTTANTVTGKVTSLSPVVAGYVSSTSSSTTTTTTSIGGGGGGVILNGLLPPGYFDANPLAKLQIQDSSFKDLTGNLVVSAKVGQQVSIGTIFKNYQQTPQDYAIIIQVVDQNGFTTDTGWVTGTVDAGQTVDNARSWTPDAEGNYTIKIFVWNNVSTNPVPLSETTTKYFTASE